MKKILFYHFIILLCFCIGCSSSKTSTADTLATQNLLSGGEFTFMAQRANPTNMDVIQVLNSWPYANSARILNLDQGYTIVISDTEVIVDLPYFGRMFIPQMDPTKNGFKFTSKNFTVDKSKTNEKRSIWVIDVKDQQNIQQIFLNISRTGRTLVSINSRDRQAISYDGYITANKTTAK